MYPLKRLAACALALSFVGLAFAPSSVLAAPARVGTSLERPTTVGADQVHYRRHYDRPAWVYVEPRRHHHYDPHWRHHHRSHHWGHHHHWAPRHDRHHW